MIEFKNLREVANYLDADINVIKEEYYNQMGQSYVDLFDTEFQSPYLSEYGELVLVDLYSDEDCKEYIMKWVIKNYDWFIMRDGAMVEITVNEIANKEMEIYSVRGTDGVWIDSKFAPLKTCMTEPNIIYYTEKDVEDCFEL